MPKQQDRINLHLTFCPSRIVFSIAAIAALITVVYFKRFGVSRANEEPTQSIFTSMWSSNDTNPTCDSSKLLFRFAPTFMESVFDGKVFSSLDYVAIEENKTSVTIVRHLRTNSREKVEGWRISLAKSDTELKSHGLLISEIGQRSADADYRDGVRSLNEIMSGGLKRCS